MPVGSMVVDSNVVVEFDDDDDDIMLLGLPALVSSVDNGF